MTLKDTFCSSPWFHMRIANDGSMSYCRWTNNTKSEYNIASTHPIEFFQTGMQSIRDGFLSGQTLASCNDCYQMEQYGKISGRQRQLLKTGVRLQQFEKTMLSSPWASEWSDSEFLQLPQDWQIDLGNYCNSSCIMCIPESSSRVATEHMKLGWISQLPRSNWVNNAELLNKFIDTLKATPNIQYIHFLGGETVITPAFKTILQVLIDSNLAQDVSIGLTTNLTVWSDDIVDLLCKFKTVNLGMSIETFTPVNDYVRWPAKLSVVNENLNKWLAKAKEQDWYLQFRTTPNVLTIKDLITVYDFAWDNNITVESCNFLKEPECMKVSVLPLSERTEVVEKMKAWLDARTVTADTVVNTRNPHTVHSQIHQDLHSYVRYLENEPDHSDQLPALVKYLKQLETLHCNSVLDYKPEYEYLFRAAGY